jgi:hypothetical protein
MRINGIMIADTYMALSFFYDKGLLYYDSKLTNGAKVLYRLTYENFK